MPLRKSVSVTDAKVSPSMPATHPLSDGGRLSALCSALLRIGPQLDVEPLLREVAETTGEMTGRCRVVLATIGADGTVEDFVTSGMSAAERRTLQNYSDGQRLFEHFRDLERPLHVPDLRAFVRDLGFVPDPLPSQRLLGMPMRHDGDHVGNLYLLKSKDGGTFTAEDEQILALFAWQAAAAIGRARAFRAERRARNSLEALVESSPVAVAMLDGRTGAPVTLNAEARRIMEKLRAPGCPLSQVPKTLSCRFPDGREIVFAELSIPQVLSGVDSVGSEEVVLSSPDGRSVAMLVNVTRVRGEGGDPDALVVTMQDLAPFEDLERARAEFVELVSHELRLPLTSIKGSTAAVLDAPGTYAPAEQHEFFRIIDQQANRMLRLINDLLDAGRIRTGTLSVAPEPTDAHALIDQARSAFVAGGGRHTVQVDLPPNLPHAMADRQRIVQVLDNLLANAARHAPESTPIRITAVRDGFHLAFSVADEGSGIAAEHLANLFHRYPRHRAGLPSNGGAGLGLAICKGLVEAHGGRISADSGGTGRGACFTFTLPVAPASTGGPASPAAHESTSKPPGDPKRILIVDDDPRMLRHTRDTLSEAGFAPLAIADHRELGQVIRNEEPALVLLDLVMPGTDGIELLQRVPELAEVPVVFVSAYGRDETIARALEAGAADYVVKPFSPTELTARIRAILRRTTRVEPFVCRELSIDFERRVVTVADCPVTLTPTEYGLLCALALGAGRVISHLDLVRQVWRGRGDAKVVRAFVKQLRRKLGDPADNPRWISNVRGVGYRMALPHQDTQE